MKVIFSQQYFQDALFNLLYGGVGGVGGGGVGSADEIQVCD